MFDTLDIRIRLDSDGVFAAFAEAILARLGFHPDDPDADTKAMWNFVAKEQGFWENLALLPGAHDLWNFVKAYDPSFLTGVGSNPTACKAGKKAFFRNHFGCDKAVVVESNRKADFCRPGDILIDDKQKNIDAWEQAGGIGILHTDVPSTIAKLKALGLDGMGNFGPELVAHVKELRSNPESKRHGYSAYAISEDCRTELAARFPLHIGAGGVPYRLVCDHITRSFPVRMDTVDDAQPKIEVIGEFVNHLTGHHVLAVTVDGKVRRDDGELYHITFALDDTDEAMEVREGKRAPKTGFLETIRRTLFLDTSFNATDLCGQRPRAYASVETLWRPFIDGGGEQALFNLPPERRLVLDAEYTILERYVEPKKVKVRVQEVVAEEPYSHPSGLMGRKVIRTKGDSETTSLECSTDGGETWVKHAEEGEPAIIRRNTVTDKVLFTAYYREGVDTKGPWHEDAEDQPNFRR
jgi:hypothetical protein